ncbi:MAG TPA: TIGR00730 family Rossman fold protein [Stellaceae bacterium]|nr:TIGR00730 family Rossman fold protein [Stellaceae bacterium]
MAGVQRVCVYCGSSGRVAEAFRESARRTGRLLAEAGMELVYGGGHVGLMGLTADAALAAGGHVVGIIPDFLHDRELAHTKLSELIVVPSMHERKQRMFERADAFAILPGGLGTLDETFECMTWKQLGLHDKPIVVVDVDGYWKPLMALIDHAIGAGFAPVKLRKMVDVVPSAEALIALLKSAPEPHVPPHPERA